MNVRAKSDIILASGGVESWRRATKEKKNAIFCCYYVRFQRDGEEGKGAREENP